MNELERRSAMVDPLREFDRLQEEINRLFDVDRFPAYTGIFDRTVSPAIDVVETDDGFRVYADLPGIDQNDIELSIANNVLTIKGEKKVVREKGLVYRSETWSGAFQRTLSLPNTVDADRIQAEMKDGVLVITLAKREEIKPRQISVKVS